MQTSSSFLSLLAFFLLQSTLLQSAFALPKSGQSQEQPYLPSKRQFPYSRNATDGNSTMPPPSLSSSTSSSSGNDNTDPPSKQTQQGPLKSGPSTTPYNPSTYICANNVQLCPVTSPQWCAGDNACYSPSQYTCVNGHLGPFGGGGSSTAGATGSVQQLSSTGNSTGGGVSPGFAGALAQGGSSVTTGGITSSTSVSNSASVTSGAATAGTTGSGSATT